MAGWAGYGYYASHSRWFWGLIGSVNDTLKGQLDLKTHGGRSFEGVA
jgi:hypothetical protein